MIDAMGKARLDLIALVLIWVGTLAITLGGVPALIKNLVTLGGQAVTLNGQELTFGHTPESQAALRRYRAWAYPGVIAISLGALWQASGPLCILFPHAWFVALFKQG